MNIKTIIDPLLAFAAVPGIAALLTRKVDDVPSSLNLEDISNDELNALRQKLIKLLTEEDALQNDNKKYNKPLADAIYHALILLADKSPLNEEDPITLDAIDIDDAQRVVVSTGHQFDLAALLNYHDQRGFRGTDLTARKTLINPILNQPMNERDVHHIEAIARKMGLSHIPFKLSDQQVAVPAPARPRVVEDDLYRLDGVLSSGDEYSPLNTTREGMNSSAQGHPLLNTITRALRRYEEIGQPSFINDLAWPSLVLPRQVDINERLGQLAPSFLSTRYSRPTTPIDESQDQSMRIMFSSNRQSDNAFFSGRGAPRLGHAPVMLGPDFIGFPEAVLSQLGQMADRLVAYPNDLETRFARAQLFCLHQEPYALPDLNYILEHQPDHVPARLARGLLHEHSSDWAAAFEDYQYVLERHPDNQTAQEGVDRLSPPSRPAYST